MRFSKGFIVGTPAIWVVLLLFSLNCAGENRTPSIQFSVKPKSCLIKDPRQPCAERITFFWQTPENVPVCIQTRLKKVLFCQKANSTNKKNFAFKVTSSTQFELIHSLTKKVLARTQLMVVKESDSNQNSRYRHPWSIF